MVGNSAKTYHSMQMLLVAAVRVPAGIEGRVRRAVGERAEAATCRESRQVENPRRVSRDRTGEGARVRGEGEEDVHDDGREESEEDRGREGVGHDDGREGGGHECRWEEDELDDGRRMGGEGSGGAGAWRS